MIKHLALKTPSTIRRYTLSTAPLSRLTPTEENEYRSRSSYSWNTRIRELTNEGLHLEALALFRRMLHPPNPAPDAFTFPSALKSCAALSLPSTAAQLHSHVLKSGCHSDAFVLTSLISAYSNLSLLHDAHHVFDETTPTHCPSDTLVVCYNALISGYALHSLSSHALSLFRHMRRSAVPFNSVTMLALIPCCLNSIPPLHACNVRSGTDANTSIANCLLTMYAKIGAIDLARQLFDELSERKELITWNAMISGYAQNGLAAPVLDLYRDMERSGNVQPDEVTLVGVLSACSNLGARAVGRGVERYIAQKPSFGSNMFLMNALINMLARCGDLARASEIFDGMLKKSVFSWTAIIAGYGMHGHGEVAVQLFDRMQAVGILPDGVAMVSVLSACSHAGLTEKGLEYFSNMGRVYGVVPGLEHYACMVDLLGRAGRLKDAWELIGSMPVEPDGAVWGALLGACKIHKNVELAELAFEHVVKLEPTNVGYYVLLSNIYSDAGMLDGMARVRGMMRQKGLRKDPGCSYIEHKQRIHLFLADDHSHPQTKSIYRMIDELEALLKEASGMKKDNKNKTNNDKNEEEATETVTGIHSEKLAIAFGLLNTEAGIEIVVIKNLRVCEDCHLFIKLISKIVNRKVVVRDASRFHHFEGGVCSCSDYW